MFGRWARLGRTAFLAAIVGGLVAVLLKSICGAVGLLFVACNGTWALAALLALLAVWLPKHLFASHYHHPAVYDWINEPSLVLALFVTACWWRTRRDGRLPPAAKTASPLAWALMYLFPGHALNPMVFAPGDVFRARRAPSRT